MHVNRVLTYFSNSEHVENRLKILQQNLNHQTKQATMSLLSSGGTKQDQSVFMTDLQESYVKWFEGGSDTSVPSIFQHQKLDLKKKKKKKTSKKNISKSKISGGVSTNVSSYDGSTSTSFSSESTDTTSDTSSVIDDILDERFDPKMSNLSAGRSSIYDQSELNGGRHSPSQFLNGSKIMSKFKRIEKQHRLDL
jgi:hypothetical protein